MKYVFLLCAGLTSLFIPLGAAQPDGDDANRTLEIRRIVTVHDAVPSGRKPPGSSGLPKNAAHYDANATDPDPDIIYIYTGGGAHAEK